MQIGRQKVVLGFRGSGQTSLPAGSRQGLALRPLPRAVGEGLCWVGSRWTRARRTAGPWPSSRRRRTQWAPSPARIRSRDSRRIPRAGPASFDLSCPSLLWVRSPGNTSFGLGFSLLRFDGIESKSERIVYMVNIVFSWAGSLRGSLRQGVQPQEEERQSL